MHLFNVKQSFSQPITTPKRLNLGRHLFVIFLPHLMNTLNQALLENDPGTIAPPMTLNDESALVQQSKMIPSENAADPGLHCRPKIQLNRIVTSGYPNFNRIKK